MNIILQQTNRQGSNDANSTDKLFRVEGTVCIAWRDAVQRKRYTMFDEVLAGTRGIPTEEEPIAELPAFNWTV